MAVLPKKMRPMFLRLTGNVIARLAMARNEAARFLRNQSH
jgi:hypothetical protein